MGYIKSLGFMYGESYPSSRSVYLRYWCRGSSERAQSTRKKKKQSSQFFTKTHIFTQSKFNFRFANHERHSTFLSKENIRLDDFEHLRHFQICRSRPETIAPKVWYWLASSIAYTPLNWGLFQIFGTELILLLGYWRIYWTFPTEINSVPKKNVCSKSK